MLKKQAEKITKIEIRTIDDIADSLAEIQQLVEIHRNNLSGSERDKISRILTEILKNEELFKKLKDNPNWNFQFIDNDFEAL